jgi:hypothetical protein
MQPEFLSAAFLSALFAIVLIDLVLAGDNALIIGLIARNLPRQTQRKVIFWGTFGAIAARGLMAIVVVHVLDLPGFMLAGAIALVWIARKMLTPDPEAAGGPAAAAPAASFAAALRTIVPLIPESTQIWLFLGFFGAHRFYVGRWFSGFLYAISFGFYFIGWGIDFFLVPWMVRRANEYDLRQVVASRGLTRRRSGKVQER